MTTMTFESWQNAQIHLKGGKLIMFEKVVSRSISHGIYLTQIFET